MAGHGGARVGSGPKKKVKATAVLPAIKKSLAIKLQNDELTEARWKSLRNIGGAVPSLAASRLRFDVERYIWDRAEGRPVQQVRLANPTGEDGNPVPFAVDVTSARDKLIAALISK